MSYSSSFGDGSIEDDEERKRREREQLAQVQRAYYQTVATQSHAVSSYRPPAVDHASPAVSAPQSQRYVLEAHDVNDMGGTPSRLQISDRQSGEVLKTVDLPQGDSRTIVDLPPGQYNFTAVAGERPSGSPNPDRLDNFRVEVFQANSPGGGGSSAAPSGASGS
jgi:hypothetical protein